jgi:Dual-action HEIGH metallo-peptidase
VIVYPNPNTGPSTLDTRPLNTSTPDIPQWTFYNEGERELRSGSNISLNCGSSVTYVEAAKTYNVVKCEPFFFATNEHLDAAEIDILLPSNSQYSAGLNDAIADWNSKLAGTGVHFNRKTTSCTTTGPHCVNVIPDTTILICGYGGPGGTNANGVAQNPVIKINSNFTFTVTGLQRTFAHEIGHLLGMDNYLPCPKNDAVMQEQFYCDQNEMANVTTSDWLPVVKSVYGGGTKSRCGWY